MRPVHGAVRRFVVASLLSALALAGCSSEDSGSTPSSDTSATESSASDAPTAPSDGSASAEPAPQTASAEGPCPYLDIEFVKETIGQNLSTSIVTTVTPQPGPGPKCDFQRPNGELAASVDTLTAGSAEEAQAAALDFAPGGNPVDAGEGGSVLVKQGEAQTLLAAYQGTLVVYVVINQESSLEAELLAEQVVAVLG